VVIGPFKIGFYSCTCSPFNILLGGCVRCNDVMTGVILYISTNEPNIIEGFCLGHMLYGMVLELELRYMIIIELLVFVYTLYAIYKLINCLGSI